MGFNTRILDEAVAARAMPPALASMATEDSYFSLPMEALINGKLTAVSTLDRIYSPELRHVMTRGLSLLATQFPGLHSSDMRLIGPTLEGVGWCPKVDGDLRLLDTPAWVTGDACGLFRGIVTAVISGHYAAGSAIDELRALG